MQDNDRFLDLVNIISLIIGMQNLQENREQSAHNNIHTENDLQAKYLLAEINKQFAELSTLLNKIIDLLERSCNGRQD